MKTPSDWTALFNKKNRIYTQLFFWCLIFSLFIILKEYPLRFTGASLICIVLQQTLEFAIPCYSQNYWVLPLLRKGKWLAGTLSYIGQIVLLVYGLPWVLNVVGLLFARVFHMEDRVDWTGEHITFSVIAFTIVASFFKIALDKLMLDKEQKETELRQLKAQLNPHFLFNTLNNLYGLSVVKSDKLPQLMLKLSDLLRYSLYDTNQNLVPLQKELTYIANYIELEKIRLDDKTQILFDIQGDFSDHSIAPLMLIVFVENSFKHYSAARNQKAFVYAHVNLQGRTLHTKIRNSLDPSLYKENTHTQGKGIGLTNVRQRLRLLYPQKHTLLITQEPDYYEVDLKIDLY